MILTGFNSVTGKFYSSTGLYAVFETEYMQDMNLSFMGPTGYRGTFQFVRGKVYDTTGAFIHTYNSGSRLKFEFLYGSQRYTTQVNDDLVSANRLFAVNNPTNNLTGYVISGRYSGNLNASFSLYGNRPGLYFSPLTTTDLIHFNGYVRATGAATELFSFNPNNATATTTPVGKFNSGNYTLSGAGFNSGSIINTNFNFDFGLHNENLSIIVHNTGVPTGVISAILYDQTFTTGQLGDYVQYMNGNISSFWTSGTSFEAYCRFLYRSGQTTFYGTGIGTGRYSGTIVGSGYLTSLNLSGYVSGGYFKKHNYTVSTGITPTFVTGASGQIFAYATGQILHYYRVSALGREFLNDVFDPEPKDFYDLTTGYISGVLTGFIGLGSGRFVFNQQVVGIPVSVSGFYFTGAFPGGTGSNRGYYNAVTNPQSTYKQSGAIYTGWVSYTGILTANMFNYPGTGTMTGTLPLSIYSENTGLMTGFNFYTGQPHELTGTYDYVRNIYYNYALNGFRTGGFLKKSTTDLIPQGMYNVGLRITYDRNAPWGVRDYIRLTAKNQYTGGVNLTMVGYSISEP